MTHAQAFKLTLMIVATNAVVTFILLTFIH